MCIFSLFPANQINIQSFAAKYTTRCDAVFSLVNDLTEAWVLIRNVAVAHPMMARKGEVIPLMGDMNF